MYSLVHPYTVSALCQEQVSTLSMHLSERSRTEASCTRCIEHQVLLLAATLDAIDLGAPKKTEPSCVDSSAGKQHFASSVTVVQDRELHILLSVKGCGILWKTCDRSLNLAFRVLVARAQTAKQQPPFLQAVAMADLDAELALFEAELAAVEAAVVEQAVAQAPAAAEAQEEQAGVLPPPKTLPPPALANVAAGMRPGATVAQLPQKVRGLSGRPCCVAAAGGLGASTQARTCQRMQHAV